MNVVVLPPETGEAPAERRDVVKLHWGGLIGGIAVALGVWLLLTILGLAVGLSSLDPRDSISALKDVGIGTGVWTIVVSAISLFAGGVVAARTSGFLDRPAGAVHGAVLWSLATILTVVLMSGLVRDLVRGVANTAGFAVTTATQAGGDIGQALGIDAQTLITPINDRLRAEGKPTLTTAGLQRAIEDAAATALREGRLDRELLITSLAENTRLSRDDAREMARGIEAQLGQTTGSAMQNVKSGAFGVANSLGEAMWWVFLAMVLGLAASVAGATLGVTRKQRERVATPVESIPLATTREVHP